MYGLASLLLISILVNLRYCRKNRTLTANDDSRDHERSVQLSEIHTRQSDEVTATKSNSPQQKNNWQASLQNISFDLSDNENETVRSKPKTKPIKEKRIKSSSVKTGFSSVQNKLGSKYHRLQESSDESDDEVNPFNTR